LKGTLACGSNYPISRNDPKYYVQVPALLCTATGYGEQTITRPDHLKNKIITVIESDADGKLSINWSEIFID